MAWGNGHRRWHGERGLEGGMGKGAWRKIVAGIQMTIMKVSTNCITNNVFKSN